MKRMKTAQKKSAIIREWLVGQNIIKNAEKMNNEKN